MVDVYIYTCTVCFDLFFFLFILHKRSFSHCYLPCRLLFGGGTNSYLPVNMHGAMLLWPYRRRRVGAVILNIVSKSCLKPNGRYVLCLY